MGYAQATDLEMVTFTVGLCSLIKPPEK